MKIIVFLADGFEEVEALTVVDYLRRVDIEVCMVSIKEERSVKGAHNIELIADKIISEIGDIKSYDGLVIPGGLPGATNLRDNKDVIEIVKDMYKDEKLIAAICAGPIVLAKAGIIDNTKVTSYPGFEDQLKKSMYVDHDVVTDGNIITSRGPSLAINFALEIVRYLLGEEKEQELKEDILYI